MKVYIGEYWVPFPSSEYGGMWAVIAENKDQCIEMLKGTAFFGNDYDYLIPDAVEKAWALVLHPDYDKHGQKPGILKPEIIETFFT